MPTGIPAPQFKMSMLWLKWMKNGSVVAAWDMLANVGSPGHSAPPQIPAWTADQGSYNLQIEATVTNLSSQTLTVKFRVQVCPRNTSGLPPLAVPPCGQLVDSGASIAIGSEFAWILPIWQLQMWSENVDIHCEIVDANDQTVYNCMVPYVDNAGYRADDWYIPVDVKSAIQTYTVTVQVLNYAVQGPVVGATVTLT